MGRGQGGGGRGGGGGGPLAVANFTPGASRDSLLREYYATQRELRSLRDRGAISRAEASRRWETARTRLNDAARRVSGRPLE